MEKIQNFGNTIRHERVMRGITADATQSEIIKVMEQLVAFDERYGRETALKYAKEVDAFLHEAHEILEEFISDNEGTE